MAGLTPWRSSWMVDLAAGTYAVVCSGGSGAPGPGPTTPMTCANRGNPGSVTATITTTGPSLIILAISYAHGDTITTPVGSSLTYIRRTKKDTTLSGGYIGSIVEIWYATSSGALSGETVTVSVSGGVSGVTVLPISVNNATGFDANASLPASVVAATGSTTNTVTGITASTGHYALFFIAGIQINTTPANLPAGWTSIGTCSSSGGDDVGIASHDYVTSPSSQSLTYTASPSSGGGWLLVDVLT